VYPLRGPDVRDARALVGGHPVRGIRVTLRRYPGAIASDTRRRGADIVLARVYPSYPDPVAALRAALGNGVPLAGIDDLAGAARRVAAERLELRVLRQVAPAAAFGTPVMPQFFSARVGCETFQPLFFGVDLAALCLRP
jgi:hypothetical protein